MDSKEYWAERQAKAQERITSKNIKETEKQLHRYYKKTLDNVVGQFNVVYSKVISNIEDGVSITPADLYKLDSYWKMQGKLRHELEKLGDKQVSIFHKYFSEQFMDIYNSIDIPDSGVAFSQINEEAVLQMINEIWCADGQSWSNRVWKNTDKLQQALNDNLIACVVSGASTEQLKKQLVEQFDVAYNRADSIVRTEFAHIQTQASRKRYEDAGVQEVEVWADYDERRCDVCGKLHQKIYPVYAKMPIPAHPRCRCCIIPVVDI